MPHATNCKAQTGEEKPCLSAKVITMALADKTISRSEGEQALAAPSISLPKGGGAIRGIG